MSSERDFILGEIRRLHGENGRSPGLEIFSKTTGIPKHRILGVHWPRWSDALSEVGLETNKLTQRFDGNDLLHGLALFTRKLGRFPSQSDIKFAKRNGASLANPDVYTAHFSNVAGVKKALRSYCQRDLTFADLLPLIPDEDEKGQSDVPGQMGHVYLLQSGEHYKVGRTDNLERRIKEVSVAMPTAVVFVHAIATDDPVGIEGYWHRRFADRRANGEWFKLGRDEVAAFRRRKFQ